MDKQKIFCGSGKEWGQYGTVNLNLCLDDLPDEYVTMGKNGRRYVKLRLNKLKDATEDRTHYIEVDTWKPKPKETDEAPLPAVNSIPTEEIPF